MESSDFREEFIRLARVMDGCVHRMVDPVARQECGLSPQQMSVLATLRLEPGMPSGEASDRAGILRTNFAQICRRLEEEGCVERRRADDDRRVMRLYLTEKGEELVDAFNREIDGRFEQMCAGEPPEEFDRAVEGLRSVREFLERLS